MVGGLLVMEVRAPEVAVVAVEVVAMAVVLLLVVVVAAVVVVGGGGGAPEVVGRVCLVDAAVLPCGWNDDELLVPIAVEDDRAWVVL